MSYTSEVAGAYKTLAQGGTGEIEEKKSRFICNIKPVSSEEEAAAFIAEMKKKYWDARHNCSAFVIGKGQELTRCSDDGEPSGTAGRPMLEVLTGEGLCDVVAVVTRYFGGTLLGTGGLIRAYTGAVKAGIAAATPVLMCPGIMVRAEFEYPMERQIRHLLTGKELVPEAEYTDKVCFTIRVPADQADALIGDLTEITGGKAICEKGEEVWYGKPV